MHELPAVHHRHAHVQQDETGAQPSPQQLQPFLSVTRAVHHQVLELQRVGNGLADVVIVIDDQDLIGAHAAQRTPGFRAGVKHQARIRDILQRP